MSQTETRERERGSEWPARYKLQYVPRWRRHPFYACPRCGRRQVFTSRPAFLAHLVQHGASSGLLTDREVGRLTDALTLSVTDFRKRTESMRGRDHGALPRP